MVRFCTPLISLALMFSVNAEACDGHGKTAANEGHGSAVAGNDGHGSAVAGPEGHGSAVADGKNGQQNTVAGKSAHQNRVNDSGMNAVDDSVMNSPMATPGDSKNAPLSAVESVKDAPVQTADADGVEGPDRDARIAMREGVEGNRVDAEHNRSGVRDMRIADAGSEMTAPVEFAARDSKVNRVEEKGANRDDHVPNRVELENPCDGGTIHRTNCGKPNSLADSRLGQGHLSVATNDHTGQQVATGTKNGPAIDGGAGEVGKDGETSGAPVLADDMSNMSPLFLVADLGDCGP